MLKQGAENRERSTSAYDKPYEQKVIVPALRTLYNTPNISSIPKYDILVTGLTNAPGLLARALGNSACITRAMTDMGLDFTTLDDDGNVVGVDVDVMLQRNKGARQLSLVTATQLRACIEPARRIVERQGYIADDDLFCPEKIGAPLPEHSRARGSPETSAPSTSTAPSS